MSKVTTSGGYNCETVHGDVHHHQYDKEYDPNKWRFSIERIVIYICVAVLIGMALC